MLQSIKKGDKLKCLKCGETIELNDNTMIFDCFAEYIKCEKCGFEADIQYYHMMEEKVE